MTRAVAHDEAWGTKEVERYTGIHLITIWKLIKEGRFPQHHYVLGKKKFWKSEVIQWVADQPQAPVKNKLTGGAR